jgi:hypothetical protein
VRFQQADLDRYARHLVRRELTRGRPAPAAQILACRDGIARPERTRDLPEIVAELAETHREVQHRDVPQPGEHRAHGRKQVVHDENDDDRGEHREHPRQHAVVELAGIQLALQCRRVTLECRMHGVSLPQRVHLLEQQRRE